MPWKMCLEYAELFKIKMPIQVSLLLFIQVSLVTFYTGKCITFYTGKSSYFLYR